MSTEWRAAFQVNGPNGKVHHGNVLPTREDAEDHRNKVRDSMLDLGDAGPVWVESREVEPWGEVDGSRRDDPGFGQPADEVEYARRDANKRQNRGNDA